MKAALVLLGIVAWAGVAGLSLLMAEWDEPVWGFFPIAGAVLVAWGIGEYVTDRVLVRESSR